MKGPSIENTSPKKPTRRETLRAGLRKLNVPDSQVMNALALLPAEAVGVLVYGSRARGDFTPNSDLDLIALVAEPLGSRSVDNVRVSCYTREQLATAETTLFGAHLARDAVVILDTDDILSDQLDSMGEVDPRKLLTRVRDLSSVLTVNEEERIRYLPGACRIARYLLRTAIYASAIASGQPCFSIRELAARLRQPELATILSADPAVHGPPSSEKLNDLTARLVNVVGPLPRQLHGSIRAIVVNEWYSDPDLATLATLAISDARAEFDYAELAKVLL